MKHHALRPADGTKRGNVLNHANFVIHKHHAGQNGVGPNGSLKNFKVQQPIGLHIQVSHIKTLALKFAAGVKHRLVLGFHGDDVFTLGLVKVRRPF